MSIHFSGTLTERQFNQFNRLGMPDFVRWGLKWFPWCFLGYTLIKILSFSGYITSFDFILALLVLLFFFLFLPKLQKRQIKRAWQSNKLIQGEISGVVDQEEIAWNHAYGEMRFPWDIILNYREAEDMLLLYTAINQALIMPRSFFHSQEDWLQFKELVTKKLSKK